MSSPDRPVHVVSVPAQESRLVPPPRDRVRALKRHLIESLRDLRKARHPERLIQKPSAQPEGFAVTVMQAGCATCQGHCCRGGGEHAYLDERTMARVRRDNPDLDAAGIIALYLRCLASESYEGSCLFHGAGGCTLARPLRAELCSTYFCRGLWDYLLLNPRPDRVVIAASHGKVARRSAVIENASVAD